MTPARARDNKTKDKTRKQSTDKKRQVYRKKSNPDEPGVQRLKASLRQTRRLLAKDNLAPDVQIQAERKLKSLEADLAKAELRRKERSMAVRYHKVITLDRQKVTRKLKQTKRALEASGLEKKERKKLQKELLKHRIDLNYIINYPKLDKYIALYPSTVANVTDNSETDRLREERRAAVRRAMENGEMDAEPEMKWKVRDQEEQDEDDEGEGDEEREDSEEGLREPSPATHRSTRSKPESKKPGKRNPEPGSALLSAQKLVNVQEDDFFDT
ncbi:rRNA-processing protein EFG1 [Ceratobasidium sp. AG-Ba]|nr:rRNA-processing protein EFG1 [Ceratobasidium sp. AG-Ba]